MTTPINLTQAKERRYSYWEKVILSDGHPSMVETDCTDEVLALIDTAEAAIEAADAWDSVAIYPEGAFGIEECETKHARLRQTLNHYNEEQLG
jgi:hypothetical protein